MLLINPLNIGKLSNLEYGQHQKSVLKNISLLGSNLITDVTLQNYLVALNNESAAFDKAMVQISKSDETAKIVAADQLRDNAIISATRFLSAFEFTEIDTEKLAYDSLITVFKAYKGVQYWNFEQETNGITNMVEELLNEKHNPHVVVLNMTPFITRMAVNNEKFKTLFEGRTQEIASKEVYNVKLMRNQISILYNDMADYILSMAKAHSTDEQYQKLLNVINVVRKYYADLLAKRKPAKKGETETPIPPLEG